MSYVQKLDNTFWIAYDTATWNTPVAGEWYDNGLGTGLVDSDTGGLITTGSWATGYRPPNLRITLSVVSGSFTILVSVKNYPANHYLNAGHVAPSPITITTTPTAFVFPLDFSAIGVENMDITYIELNQSPASQGSWSPIINNVEFDDPAPPAAFWQNFVKTSETDA